MNRGNSICLHHKHHRGSTKVRDGFNNGTKHVLVGVPHDNIVSSSKGTNQTAGEGYLHCGCHINVALLDFFWWKTWVLKSPRADFEYSEGMGVEVTPPRVRAFFAAGFMEATGMTLDDLYACKVGSLGYNSKEVRMFQLRNMLQLVNQLNAQDGTPPFVIGSLTPNPEL